MSSTSRATARGLRDHLWSYAQIWTLGYEWAFVSLLNGPLFPVSRFWQQREALDRNFYGWNLERFCITPFLHLSAAPGCLFSSVQFLDCDHRRWSPAVEKQNPGFCSLWNCTTILEVRWFLTEDLMSSFQFQPGSVDFLWFSVSVIRMSLGFLFL